ncbi:DUF5133 domain-containing protein [Streptomyces poonensis]|uniref:DUF5133 domain-containing protein n=1 Tax=Streptomyces poonensis TaxID=68255 RepID=A0A918PCP9_9ACTN|nr:DUF5133 domain-containing protein [Streptomyces poonensis]GGZ00313.1 DUF5133 domain-containing protein [Streptomyces poonensis]GLJ92125.1 DUF5133 domain-containing protein [Streptomyces poonensis]
MLKPHPAVLRKLVEEYEKVSAEKAHEGEERDGRPDRRAQDLAYTLCVSTGTRDVRRALEEAYRLLAAEQEPVPGGRRPYGAKGLKKQPATADAASV